MKQFYTFCLLIATLSFNTLTYTQTYSGDARLYSQADVNSFGANGYTAITGNLSIDGADITDLTPLSTITTVGEKLFIGSILGGNPSLSSLEGLHNITYVGNTLYIANNSSLPNLEGLRNITSVGNNLSILENDILANLDGLRSITSSGGSASVGEGNLTVERNPFLTNLDGLGNITSFSSNGIISIKDNSSLNRFCGLYGIFSSSWSGNYYVSGNLSNPTKTEVLNDGPCSSLPVELTTFTATINNKIVELNWQTATEINNYGFEIEKQKAESGNQHSEWNKIGFVEGHGNSNSPKYYTFTDNVTGPGKFSYRLKQIDIDGQFEYSDIVEVNLGLPTEFSLSQNYPNPFNPTTTINYSIPTSSHLPKGRTEEGFVSLKVYDILGKEVATLVNEKKSHGTYKVTFDTSNLSSGIYFYKLEASNFVETKKMILLR